MQICVDIRPTLKRKTGIGYYTLNLINALGEIDKLNRYQLFSYIKFFNFNKKLPCLPSKNFKHKVYHLKPISNRIGKECDLYHTSSFDLLPHESTKLIGTIHDIIPKVFPEGHTQDTIDRLDRDLEVFLERACKIIVDADYSRKELLTHYPVAADKIEVVYPGVDEILSLSTRTDKASLDLVRKKYNIDGDYILYVGTIEPRKNIKGLLEAFILFKSHNKTNRHKLVIVGMKGWMHDEVFAFVKRRGLAKDVIFTGYVPRDQVGIFYCLADMFIYPSFYEGAGLPILEAFSCSLPVICSNASCLPEIAGDAAYLINPYKPSEIADAIECILVDKDLREQLIEKGRRRAGEFTWEKTAERMLDIFKSAI